LYKKFDVEKEKKKILIEINRKMKEEKISGIELASNLKVSKAYISNMLNQKGNFSLEKLISVASFMGIKIAIVY
jgi:predicted XRE-type DNA-binding protein